MTELDSGHEFVESDSGVLPDKKIFGEVGLRMLFFEQLDEIVEKLSMHFLSYNEPFFPVLIEFTQREDLFCLELI